MPQIPDMGGTGRVIKVMAAIVMAATSIQRLEVAQIFIGET